LLVDTSFLLYFGERSTKFIEELEGNFGIFGILEITGY
jgi:hypothetical protein